MTIMGEISWSKPYIVETVEVGLCLILRPPQRSTPANCHQFIYGSSKGRTAHFDCANGGLIPSL